MPIFQNITESDLMLDREDGLVPMMRIVPNGLFQGSLSFYSKFIGNPEYLLERSINGLNIDNTEFIILSNSIRLFLNYSINQDNMIAETKDAIVNPTITAGTIYTCWGSLYYYDSNILRTSYFSIQGDNDHGALGEATFVIDNGTTPGGSPQPIAAGSRINCHEGNIIFKFINGLPDSENDITMEIIFDNLYSNQRMNQWGKPLISGPSYSYSKTYVESGDIGENYVNNSMDQIKTEKIFLTGSQIGDPAKLKTYYYKEDNGVIANPTHIIEEDDFVNAEDMA